MANNQLENKWRQNSAGTQHGELNSGSKKPQKVGNHFCGRREDRDWGGGVVRIWDKHPSPKAAGEKVENWKQAQGLNSKREKGERTKERV